MRWLLALLFFMLTAGTGRAQIGGSGAAGPALPQTPTRPLTVENIPLFGPLAAANFTAVPPTPGVYYSRYNDWMVSDDGSIAIMWSNSGAKRIWDFKRGEPIEIRAAGSPLAISPDNQLLAIANGDAIWLWDIPSTSLQRRIRVSDYQTIAQFSPDSSQLLYTYVEEGQLYYMAGWDLKNGQQIFEMPTGSSRAVFSKSGTVAAFCNENTLEVYNIPDMQPISQTPLDYCIAPRLNADGSRALAGAAQSYSRYGSNGIFYLIDTAQGRTIAEISETAREGEFSPDGTRVLTETRNTQAGKSSISVWDAITGQPLNIIEYPTSRYYRSSAHFLSAQVIQTHHYDSQVNTYRIDFWDAERGDNLFSSTVDRSNPYAEFTPVGTSGLVSIITQESVVLWGVNNLPPALTVLPGRVLSEYVSVRAEPNLNAPIIGRAGGSVNATAYRDGFVYLDAEQGWARVGYPYVEASMGASFEILPSEPPARLPETEVEAPIPVPAENLPPLNVEIAPPVVPPSEYEAITPQSMAQVKLLGMVSGSLDAVSADGTTALIGGAFWHLPTLQSWPVFSLSPDMAAISAHGERIATVYGTQISVYDFETREARLTLEMESPVTRIALTEDGTRIAVWSIADVPSESAVMVWDVDSGDLLHRLANTAYSPQAFGFSPDGTLLAATSTDAGLSLWDAATGEVIPTPNQTGDLVSFSPDWRLIALSNGSGLMRIWDSEAREIRYTLDTLCDSALFSPDLRRAILNECENYSEAQLWDIANGDHLTRFSSRQYWFYADGSKFVYRRHSTAIVASASDGATVTDFTTDTPDIALSADGSIAVTNTGVFDIARRNHADIIGVGSNYASVVSLSADLTTFIVAGNGSVGIYGIPDAERAEWTGIEAEIKADGTSLWSAPRNNGRVIGSVQGSVRIAGYNSGWVRLLEPEGWVRFSSLASPQEAETLPQINR